MLGTTVSPHKFLELPGWERIWLAAASVAICLVVLAMGIAAIVARNNVGDMQSALFYALIGTVALVGALAEWARRGGGPLPPLARRLPQQLDGTFRRRPAVASLSLGLFVVALIQVARLSCFMADPALTWGSAYPPVEFGVSHMCISAYVLAGDLSRRNDPNVYAIEHYPAFKSGASTDTSVHRSAVLNLDVHLRDAFEYPPPFLLLPRAALALSNNFLDIRTGWFMLQLPLFCALALALARFVGGPRGVVAGLLSPGLLASFPFMFNFQFGQFHLIAIMLAVGGMLAFSSGWNRTGGALLGAAIVTKLFPGLLLVYLAFQRRGRPIFWTVVFAVVYVAAGLLTLGPAPYNAFINYQLPRLLSGEAFSFNLVDDLTLATNASLWSIPFKLRRLGVAGMSAQLSIGLTWLYTGALLWVTYTVARRNREPVLEPLIWLGLLTLGSLRSPDAPIVYVGTAALWALSLLAVETQGRARRVIVFVLVWIFAGVVPPAPTPEATIILWMIVQFVLLALGFYVTLRHYHSVGSASHGAPRACVCQSRRRVQDEGMPRETCSFGREEIC
jgi:alpha-1,2-mannosyltransferase